MFTLTLRAVGVRRLETLLSTLLLAALFSATAYGQIGEGAGLGDAGVRNANNSIQGNIFEPNGRRFERRLQIRLSSVRGIDFSTMSNENGSFSFRRLPAGTYTITVDAGREYVPMTESVYVYENFRTQSGQTYVVQFQLQMKPTNEARASVVNAALAGVPKAALEFYESAAKSAQTGDSKKAVELLKSAIEIYPQFMLAHNELGVQYFKLGDLDKAAPALREAIKLSPETFSPRFNHGVVLFYKKQYQSAGEELDHALKVNGSSAVAHLFRGRVFIKVKEFAKAEQEFRRALSLGGGGEINEAHRFLGGIYNEQGHYARALQELETYLKLSPNVKDAEEIRLIIQELRAKTTTSKK